MEGSGDQQVPYKVNMDPDEALKLVKHAASLLVMDVPPSTSFGMDCQMFVVGPNFKGMKMIPPGPHFVYYSAGSRHGNGSAPIIGFFIFTAPSEVIVRRWDPQEERLVKLADNSEEERFVIGVKNLDFDAHLGPYDLHHYQEWKRLSSYITKNVIERLEPVGSEITVMSEAELIEKGPQTAAERRLTQQLANARKCYENRLASSGKVQSGSHRCFYTPIPHSVKHRGMTAAELTALNLDKTQILETLLEQKYGGCEDLLLGELQFAFIAFLMGQSLEAFGQWKAIVSLLLSCEEAPLHTRTQLFIKPLHTRTQLFIKALEVVSSQLKQGFQTNPDVHGKESMPFLDDSWFSEDSFLQLLFKDFFSMIRDVQPIDGELLHQTKKLKKVLEVCLGWRLNKDIDDDDYKRNDEFAPVVVTEDSILVDEEMKI